MYMTEQNEWVERNVNGKVVYYARRVAYCPPHDYIHINFPTLVFCRFLLTLLLLLLFLVYTFYVHPHVPSSILCFLFSCAAVVVSWKNFPLDTPQMCMGFLTEHVENIINFISLRFSYHLLPTLLLPFSLLSRTKTSFRSTENERKLFHFLTFLEIKFCKVILFGWARVVGVNIFETK